MRKEIDVAISEGRDAGKVFHITEMPALQTEKWARRALVALLTVGAKKPQDAENGGMASIAMIGFESLWFAQFSETEALFDELLACVTIKEPAVTRNLTPNDIEEAATFTKLRQEAFKLHVNFSTAGDGSTST